MDITTEKSTSKVGQKEWEVKPSIVIKEKEYFSADDVINAYFKGKKSGKHERERIDFEKFSKNLELAKNISEKFLQQFKQNNVRCILVYLKVVDIINFENLFLINKSDYLSDNFRNIYKIAFDTKSTVSTDTFFLNFSFMPYSSHLDETHLRTDGYILKYVEN